MRESPFFETFSDADLWYVPEISTFLRIVEGDVLIREGDVGDFLLMLLSGQVRISKRSRRIDLVLPGMRLGEIFFVLEGRTRRNTTCVARKTAPSCVSRMPCRRIQPKPAARASKKRSSRPWRAG